MFQVCCTMILFLVIGFLNPTAGDQDSLSYANCQLTTDERTTDDMSTGRSPTSEIIDKEDASNSQARFTTTQHAIDTKTQILLRTTETISEDCDSLDDFITSYIAQHISTNKQLNEVTHRKSQATNEMAEESTVAMTTDDAMKSTNDSKSSKAAETIVSFVWRFDQSGLCHAYDVVIGKDLIYVLCQIDNRVTLLFTHENSIPYDLLMITVADEIESHKNMVLIDNTNLLYVHDWDCKCIWKIDTVKNRVDKWLSVYNYWPKLSIANDNHLLVLNELDDLLCIGIYDQDARLIRRISLPRDFSHPFDVIQKPNGQFVVSHISKETRGTTISFLSNDGQIISQLSLKDIAGFIDAQAFYVVSDEDSYSHLAVDVFSGNVYIDHYSNREWYLSDLIVDIVGDPEETTGQIISVRNTDGRTIHKCKGWVERWDVRLFLDSENDEIFVEEYLFNDIILFLSDATSFKSSQIGGSEILYYDTKNKQIFNEIDRVVHSWTFIRR